MAKKLEDIIESIDKYYDENKKRIMHNRFVSGVFSGLFGSGDDKVEINYLGSYFYDLVFALMIYEHPDVVIEDADAASASNTKKYFEVSNINEDLAEIVYVTSKFKKILREKDVEFDNSKLVFQLDPRQKIIVEYDKFVFKTTLPNCQQYDCEANVDIMRIMSLLKIETLEILERAIKIYDEKTFLKKEFANKKKYHVQLSNFAQGMKEDFDRQIELLRKYYLDKIKPNMSEWKKEIKNFDHLDDLKKSLINADKNLEITNFQELLVYLPPSLKFELLQYVADHNNEYYYDLASTYDEKMNHSIIKYIEKFEAYDLKFNCFSIDNQKEIVKQDITYIDKVLEFIKKINCNDYNIIYKIIMTSNIETINMIAENVSKGIIDSNFVNRNIELLNEKSIVHNNFKINIEYITKFGINFVHKSSQSMDVLISNPEVVLNNIEYLESKVLKDNSKIGYKTRYLSNYSFLSDDNLINKIECFIKNDININEHLDILNSDDDIIVRIELLKKLNYNLVENGVLNPLIMDKDNFPIDIEKAKSLIEEEEKTI